MHNQKNIIQFDNSSKNLFNIGMRYAEKSKSKHSLKKACLYLKKAADLEPMNLDYQLNLACMLAEKGETDKSNEILNFVIMEIDPTFYECFFALGCNYFDLGDFKKSAHCFEKYIELQENGDFVEEAIEVLAFINIFEEYSEDSSKKATNFASKGRKFMQQGKFLDAIDCLCKSIEYNPMSLSARNSLSVCCYYAGQKERAIRIAKTVLKLKMNNMDANCNLALFYKDLDINAYNRQLRKLSNMNIKSGFEILKLIKTYNNLGIKPNLKKILNKNLKDVKNKKVFLMKLLDKYSANIEIENEIKKMIDLI